MLEADPSARSKRLSIPTGDEHSGMFSGDVSPEPRNTPGRAMWLSLDVRAGEWGLAVGPTTGDISSDPVDTTAESASGPAVAAATPLGPLRLCEDMPAGTTERECREPWEPREPREPREPGESRFRADADEAGASEVDKPRARGEAEAAAPTVPAQDDAARCRACDGDDGGDRVFTHDDVRRRPESLSLPADTGSIEELLEFRDSRVAR